MKVAPRLQHLHDLVSQMSPTSSQMDRAVRELMPVIASPTLDVLHPIYIQSGKGSLLTDVDGNDYIDLTMGYGPHLLGHAPDVAIAAIKRAVDDGTQFALHGLGKEPLARLVLDAFPANEMVLFCNSGSEAVGHAIRVARAFTGKSKIAVFEGGYHGVNDYVLLKATRESSATSPVATPRSAGIPPETLSTVAMLPYWTDLAFEAIHEMKGELAAVLVEPMQGENPQTEQGPWLKSLRQVCRDAGVLLIFDEVITGFRLGFGGGQGFFGVPADIVIYGKILGGGMPIGAVAGRRDVMELFASRTTGAAVSSAGTFSGNPLSMATGVAVLSHLRSHPEHYAYLHAQGNRLATELNRFLLENDLKAFVQVADSVLFLRFGQARNARTVKEAALDPALLDAYSALQLKLLLRGVILPGFGGHQFYLSTAHSAEDVDRVRDAIEQAMLEVRDEGFFGSS